MKIALWWTVLLPLAGMCPAAEPAIQFVKHFANANHPEIAYWFFSPDQLADENYLATVDRLARESPYTLVFLTARNGVDFYDYARLKPVFRKLVDRAHQQGLKIGLQLWENRAGVAPENMERAVVEGELVLDHRGNGIYEAHARHIRPAMGAPVRSELVRAYAFRKSAPGFYVPGSVVDITAQCTSSSPDPATVHIDLHAGGALAGRSVYVMTQYHYAFSSNYGSDAADRFLAALREYRDIPFDGVALDEYGNLKVAPPWELKPGELFRERTWSPAMEREYQVRYGRPLVRALFDMRYAPAGQETVRMRAINTYMDTMRRGSLHVEEAVYRAARGIYGPAAFSGFHNTYHNRLTGDEIWDTGLSWWTLPREYGHTDENSLLPTQMGIAFSAPGNAHYNMYYAKSLDRVVEKAFTDLRYGIRTIYHAVNDVQGWGVSVDKPEALAAIAQVERCTRLLNRFNPSLPRIRLLVIFGVEAVSDWYPDESARGQYDINDKLAIEEKAKELWDAGYANALVSSDVLVAGRLKLNAAGQPVLNGHTFDAVVYLYPQYARKPVLEFLERYVGRGGRLMLEGRATHDFDGHPIGRRFDAILRKAAVDRFSVDGVARLGVSRRTDRNGSLNEDGSYVFTDLDSLRTGRPATFEARFGENTYTGEYRGLAAISADPGAGLLKLAASGLTVLRKNGAVLFSLPRPADVYLARQNGGYHITIAGDPATATPAVDKLASER
jgi:hypothetical protein